MSCIPCLYKNYCVSGTLTLGDDTYVKKNLYPGSVSPCYVYYSGITNGYYIYVLTGTTMSGYESRWCLSNTLGGTSCILSGNTKTATSSSVFNSPLCPDLPSNSTIYFHSGACSKPQYQLPAFYNECSVVTFLPLTVTCTSVDVTQPCANDGKITINVSGGQGGYQVSWSNLNKNGFYLYYLTAGTYTATVTDVGGNSVSIDCVVNEPPCEFSYNLSGLSFSSATYFLQVTGTTSPSSTYSVYYDNTNLVYYYDSYPSLSSTSPATGLDLINVGIYFDVPLTATNISVKQNTNCDKCDITVTKNIEPVVVLCLNSEYNCGTGGCSVTETLNPIGLYNLKKYWESSDGVWSLKWSASTVVTNPPNTWIIYSSNTEFFVYTGTTIDPPIVTTSTDFGFTGPKPPYFAPEGATTTNGSCSQLVLLPYPFYVETESEESVSFKTIVTGGTLNLSTYVNQTICGCDGSINLYASGGIPPYSFSIDSGVTYKSFPIFNNLCFGLYNVSVMDSLSSITYDNVILNLPSPPTTYIVSLNTTSTILSSTVTTIVKKYDTIVSVTPSLPDGITLTFDINHLNTSKSSPNFDSFTSTTTNLLTINSTPISSTTQNSSTGTTLSTLDGCQLNTIYISTYNEDWSTLTLTNSDVFLLSTTTSLIQNEDVNCYIGTSEESYSITNVSISGCGCCNVVVI